MRRPRVAIALLAAIGCGAGLSGPHPAARGNDPCLPDAEGPPGARMFHKLDPLRTGRVSLERFVEHRAQRFQLLDANGDGRVTRAEFDIRHADEPAMRRAETFSRFDSNGDGAVTRAEWDAAETRRFERIDADHDGSITRGEFLADRRRICAARANPPDAR